MNKKLFNEVKPELNYVAMETGILSLWDDREIFKKSIEQRKDSPPFVFYEGPPTANGRPGAHHVLARSFKDIICRYRSMSGYLVKRKAGWDTHGLPVELEVEKELGISGKPEIEQYGIAKFNEKCRQSVMKYTTEWEELTKRIAFWLDMHDPYITYTNDYIESVWWTIKQIWDKELLYEGYKVVPHCPRCGTSLSSHEVAQGYKWVKEPSVFVRFKVIDWPDARHGDVGQVSFLAWTTTPWTLAANVALAVSPNVDYVLAKKAEGEKFILAKALVEDVLGEGTEIVETFQGKELEGKKYEPLFGFFPETESSHRITLADFVTLKEGTGIVHIAPAYGEDDMGVAQKYDLPVYHPVDEEGKYKKQVDKWTDVFVKDADPLIIRDLKESGKLLKKAVYEHSYPFCWRCDTPLLYFAKTSWFIRTTALKDRMIELNEQINWEPSHIKEGRFGNWLKSLVDWSFSRERYWGTPLPVWRCSNKDCGNTDCVGSIAELKEKSVENLTDSDIDLHRPYVDDVQFECAKCGSKMNRVKEVIDVWFDSGAMPQAQWHHPFEDGRFEQNFPADYICEAIDQTRGWFFSLHAISTMVFDSVSYKNVICLGHILDEHGEKMSKHKGNVIAPWTILNHEGADPFRWYLFTVSPPGSPKKFSEAGVKEVMRKFLLTLWNTYSFFVTYANIDKFNPLENKIPVADRPLMDKWLISKLESLVDNVGSSLENYQITQPARAISDFVDDLSNWYVRRGRRRFWKSEEDQDKLCAYQTLYEVLVTLSKLLAPFVPFISEEIYQNLVAGIDDANAFPSVHMESFPRTDLKNRDELLEKQISAIKQVVTMGRSARFKSKIRVRQPLSEMWVLPPNDAAKTALEKFTDQVIEELNVKNIVIKRKSDEFVEYRVKPNLPVIGPKHGKILGKISQALQAVNGLEAKNLVDGGKTVDLTIDGQEVKLEKDDVFFEELPKAGLIVESDQGYFIGLSTEVSDELKAEGLTREFTHWVQALRKDAALNIEDSIVLSVSGSPEFLETLENFRSYVTLETLAKEFIIGSNIDGYTGEKEIEGFDLKVSLKKA